MIIVEHLTKRFGRLEAVSDLSFEVDRGQAVALWGPNGAGKTTAMRCILGLLRYDGRVEIAGHDARRASRLARRAIGYVPQELNFYDDLRVVEALGFFARLKSVAPRRIGVVLDEVGLLEHRRKRVRELSGGMKQRLALALALLAEPPLLLLDELTSNLDAGAQSAFMSLLRDLKQRGKTILYTSHRVEEVEALADRVLVLESGRLELECAAAELAAKADVRCVLKLSVPEGTLDRAILALHERGFVAARNGTCLFVEVEPRAKAAPIHALNEAEISVRSFELAAEGDGPAELAGRKGGAA
jgi:ABC-type multidrug transport system ATPase subunit